MQKKGITPAVFYLIFILELAIPVSAFCAYDFNVTSGLNRTALRTGHLTSKFSKMSPIEIVGLVINIILSFVGIVFLILIIYAGYTWLMARDNPSEATKSRTIIKNAILGLILVASAYAITYFITSAIGTSTGLTN